MLPAEAGDIIDVVPGPLKQQIGQGREIVTASLSIIKQMLGVFLQGFLRCVFVRVMIMDVVVNISWRAAVSLQNIIETPGQFRRQIGGGLDGMGGGRGSRRRNRSSIRRRSSGRRGRCVRRGGNGSAILSQHNAVYGGTAGENTVFAKVITPAF